MPRLERQGSELQMQGWLVKRKKSGETHIGGSPCPWFGERCQLCGDDNVRSKARVWTSHS